MHVTWSALELSDPAPVCPWLPEGSSFLQAGQAGAGRADMPSFDGRWWSVLAVWDEDPQERVAHWPVVGGGLEAAWHVVLAPASFRGDAVLSGGRQPFSALPERGKVVGAAAVITLAGLSPDAARTGEFFERFVALGHLIEQAEGNCAALVQAPEDGAVLTFSAWRRLRDAVTWAYHRPDHAATVHRQEEHGLVAQGGFLRCAVTSSRGTLRGIDPLAGLTGARALAPEAA